MPISSITLGSGHSLIVGHRPKIVDDEVLCKAISEQKKDTASFGLFGGGLNYNTYYPDAKPEDFNPQDTEFIEPVFRCLSECIISKYALVDFSQGGVLKESMPLLLGQTVNCDHETEVGNAVGSISSVFWQDAYKDPETGKTIPAGINGVFKIDAKSNPRLARGIMMDPPSIHCNSVTVRFVWDKSHPELSDEDFYDKMGTYAKDGQLIRKVVTKILGYQESSLVSNGADPFAQQVRNGRIVMPKKSLSRYSFSAEEKSGKSLGVFSDYKDGYISVMSNSANILPGQHEQDWDITENSINNNTNPNEENMEELQKFLASLFGEGGVLTLGEGQEVNAETAMASITAMKSELGTLKQTVATQTTQLEELSTLKQEVEENKPLVEFGKEQLTAIRNSALESYTKLTPEKDDNIVSLIANADAKTVIALRKSYEASLEEKYPVVCKSCGSHEVSRASSVQQKSELSASGEEVNSNEQAIANIRKKK